MTPNQEELGRDISNALHNEFGAAHDVQKRPGVFLGMVCIASVVTLWVGASELIQYIFDNVNFDKPMFLTTYANALFSIYLLGFLFMPSWQSELRRSYRMLWPSKPPYPAASSKLPDISSLDLSDASDDDGEADPLLARGAGRGQRRPRQIPMRSGRQAGSPGIQVQGAAGGEGGHFSMEAAAAGKSPQRGHGEHVKALATELAREEGLDIKSPMAPIGENSPMNAATAAAAEREVEALTRGAAGARSGHGAAEAPMALGDRHEGRLTPRGRPLPVAVEDEGEPLPLAPHQIAMMAVVFSPIWLAAGYTFNLSLCTSCHTGTSVASNTVISSTTSLWALLISVLLLNEQASWGKLVAVILSCVGSAVITSRDKGESSLAGDGLCLFSAIGFGLASVLLKAYSPRDDSVNYPMFFGFLGLFHTALCLPILFVLDRTGAETFGHVNGQLVLFLTVNGLFGTVLSNVLWAKAIALTSPLTVNLGTSTSIPLSFLADYLNPHAHPPNFELSYLLGTFLVLASFIYVSILEAFAPDTTTQEEHLRTGSTPFQAEMGGPARIATAPASAQRSRSISLAGDEGDWMGSYGSPFRHPHLAVWDLGASREVVGELGSPAGGVSPGKSPVGGVVSETKRLQSEVTMLAEENHRLRESLRRARYEVGRVRAEQGEFGKL